MKTRFVATLLVAVSVASCSKKTSDVVTPAQVPPPVKPAAPQITPLEQIQGEWKSKCVAGESRALIAKTSLGVTQYTQIVVAPNVFTEHTIISAGPCESKDIEAITENALLINQTNHKDIHDMSLNALTVRVKPLTEFGVRILNLTKWCGISDWAQDQERDVTDKIGTNGKCFTNKSSGLIYSIQGSSLYFDSRDKLGSMGQSAEMNKSNEFNRL